MRERWLASWVEWCRRLAPPDLREEAFDPSVSDLVLASVPPLRFCLQVLLIALECRRLPATREVVQRSFVTQHLRVVIRRLWREPRFTAAVVLTLALGLGANLTVFTFVDAFLIARLPVPHPEALVRVGQARDNGEIDITSYLNFRDGRDMARTEVDLAAHAETVALVGPPESAEPRPLEVVSGNYFRVLGVAPQHGRLLDEGDEVGELAHPVAIVSDRFWKTRLGGRPDVVGQPLLLNGTRFEIVGVTPASFTGTYAARHIDIWAPVSMQQVVRPRGLTLESRTWGWLLMIGRLKAGVTQADAERALARAADDINSRFPPRAGDAPFAFITRPASAMADADARMLEAPLTTAYMFTGLLFLATCANLAGLMHTRLAGRGRELMIRESLGASRVRLMFEWMTECLVLAVCGGALALFVARVTAVGLARMELPLQVMGAVSFETTLQWRVVGYAMVLSVTAGVVFGLVSGWRRRIVVAGPARTRRTLVAVQVGISVVLLVVASLLTSSLHRQQTAAPGFHAADMGVLSLDLRRQRVPETEWIALTDRVVEVARAVPGVTRADIGFRAPLEPGEDQIIVRVPGYDPAHDAEGLTVDFNQVGATYFETIGVPFIHGGPWTPGASRPSVVINKTMAERYWPTRDAVGQAVLIGRTPVVVAGVVADTVYYNVGEAPRPYIYLPAHVQPPGAFVLHVAAHAGVDVPTLMETVARSLAGTDSRLAPFNVMSFDELRQVPLLPIRLLSTAAVVFGAVSLLLTVVGLFGVIAASVNARTKEIGVRLALGAAPDRIQRGVIREALVLAAAGGGVGLIAAYLTARELRTWLFDVQPFEPALSLGVVLLVSVVAALSAWVPARRASRVDPIIVLK